MELRVQAAAQRDRLPGDRRRTVRGSLPGELPAATLGDEAIAVRDIEAAVLRNVKEQKPERYVIPPKEQRVAVVGAGLAGLACALDSGPEAVRG